VVLGNSPHSHHISCGGDTPCPSLSLLNSSPQASLGSPLPQPRPSPTYTSRFPHLLTQTLGRDEKIQEEAQSISPEVGVQEPEHLTQDSGSSGFERRVESCQGMLDGHVKGRRVLMGTAGRKNSYSNSMGRSSDRSCDLQTLTSPQPTSGTFQSRTSLPLRIDGPTARPHSGKPSAASFVTTVPSAFSHITFNGLSFSSSPTYDSSPVMFYDQFHAITFSASPAFCTSAIFLQDPRAGLTLIHPASSSLGLTAVHDTSLPEPCHLCLFLHGDKRSLQLTSSASVAPSSQTPAYLFLTSPGNALFI
jgi:hypothetical protein